MRRMSKALWVGAVVAALAAGAAPRAMAGVDEAKQYLDEARKALADGNKGDAETALMLAETELEGVEGAEKATLAAAVAALQKQMATDASSAEAAEIREQAETDMADLKEAIDDWVTFNERAGELDTFLNRDETKAVLPAADITKMRTTMATYRKVAKQKRAVAALDQAKRDLDTLESSMPEYLADLAGDSPAARDNAAQSYGYRREALARNIDLLDPAKPDAAAAIAKFEKLEGQFNAAYAKAAAEDTLDYLKRQWEGMAYEYEGWDKETLAPTFAQMLKEQSEQMSNLGLPAHVELVESANTWLGYAEKNDNYQLTKDDPRIKALVAEVVGLRDKALAKLEANAEKIVAEAEKTPLDQDTRDRLEYLANDNLRLALDGSAKQAALQARVRKLVDDYDTKVLGAARAAEEAKAKLTEAAEANWPSMTDRFAIVDGFDPNDAGALRGKTVRIADVYNRVGWDYRPGQYDFACTINGVPVAGNYAPAIKAHIAEVLKRTAMDAMPEETPYELIAVVRKAGTITEMVDSEVKGTVENLEVTAQVREDQKVDCVLVDIVGLKCGPVAAVAAR